MNILVYQEVIAWSLADDLEIVHKRKLRANLRIERSLSLTCCLVFVAADQHCAAHSLWLEVELAMDATLGVNGVDKEDMKCPREMDQFACSQRRARDEHDEIERLLKVIGNRCGLRQGGRHSQYGDQHQRDCQ